MQVKARDQGQRWKSGLHIKSAQAANDRLGQAYGRPGMRPVLGERVGIRSSDTSSPCSKAIKDCTKSTPAKRLFQAERVMDRRMCNHVSTLNESKEGSIAPENKRCFCVVHCLGTCMVLLCPMHDNVTQCTSILVVSMDNGGLHSFTKTKDGLTGMHDDGVTILFTYSGHDARPVCQLVYDALALFLNDDHLTDWTIMGFVIKGV